MKKYFGILLLWCALCGVVRAQEVSVAGLYPQSNSGRVVYSFNDGWRFMLGDVADGGSMDLDDSSWQVVCAPHSVQLEPADASGGRNYQGVCWYRKHFTVPSDLSGKNIIVYFEAVMGKQEVYVNGQKVKDNYCGYLPIIINLSEQGVKAGDKCLIAVKADNSDDKNYPPGKKQTQLDFAYHGGMYRDVWLIGRSPVHITDPNEAERVAGGGIFVHYGKITEQEAEVFVEVEVEGGEGANVIGRVSPSPLPTPPRGEGVVTLKITSSQKAISSPSGDKRGALSSGDNKGALSSGDKRGALKIFTLRGVIKRPHLWSPEDPYLYRLEIEVRQGKNVVDGGALNIGIRKAEFRGKDGFWLNGKPYHQLVGGNRHQDFAYVGNALPNSQQWRDAKRLKDAGMTIIRAAHYPQDPAFMDACDELGLFIIVPTPGWQYWNKDPKWGEMVHQNTREIIRRDRNHPSVLMWEPILNETRYPKDFALEALRITQEEFPYPGRPVAAADMNSEGVKENYDVLYDWADNIGKGTLDTDKCIFTREWGEYVDDWYAHNALNRAARGWGEQAMLSAALSLSDTYGMMYRGQRQFIGGCQWHPFDHQRGYHPDAYLGGIYDAFRQKKYAFEMFRSQRDDDPMVFIAHEMTQYSPNDVVVFSNCDSVRLTAMEGWKVQTLPVVHTPDGTPHAPVVFKGFWDFWQARECSYTQRSWQKVSLVAEGIKDGRVVCSEKKMPSRRSTKIRLYADEMGRQLTADGSDFIVVVAEVTDDNGNVRRNAREYITFSVEGEGSIIDDGRIMANPRLVEWGSAPVLVRSTRQAGKIRIIARPTFEGVHAPAADTLEIESVPSVQRFCERDQAPIGPQGVWVGSGSAKQGSNTLDRPAVQMTEEERKKMLDEVEKQQQDFGIQ